ncbi:hypothetical protein ACJQWK_03770 [Exserohilum turcicum]
MGQGQLPLTAQCSIIIGASGIGKNLDIRLANMHGRTAREGWGVGVDEKEVRPYEEEHGDATTEHDCMYNQSAKEKEKVPLLRSTVGRC